ncbi:hypothetical protein [Deinococcus roseus]|uniref:Uncharacterized protein n=1 Tax=Deinococcus roseus TaxID=392414 RepID=A0ABQ2D1N3_9DEIO|nr:hypothetical protein [Deinococcus roseus]GGJ40670.1 hypothetical protein GCM10008938_28430 [Deinococcus roseus]
MAVILFFDAEGQTFTWDDHEENSKRVTRKIRDWAERNGFERLAFWRDKKEPHKLFVELGGTKLSYWVPEHIFINGDDTSVEEQLDYARGAQRRSAAGYNKFDR